VGGASALGLVPTAVSSHVAGARVPPDPPPRGRRSSHGSSGHKGGGGIRPLDRPGIKFGYGRATQSEPPKPASRAATPVVTVQVVSVPGARQAEAWPALRPHVRQARRTAIAQASLTLSAKNDAFLETLALRDAKDLGVTAGRTLGSSGRLPGVADPAALAPPLPQGTPAVVTACLQRMLKSQVLSPTWFRRNERKAAAEARRIATGEDPGPLRPDGRDPQAMVQEHLFRCGTTPLPEGATPLQPDAWKTFHIATCSCCGAAGALLPSCYFYAMHRCLVFGWAPPINPEAIKPPYIVFGNAKSATTFEAALQVSLAKQVASGALVVVPVEVGSQPGYAGIISPSGVILKSSDTARARAITQIDIKDQASLAAANGSLVAAGFEPVKVRAIFNLSASGINAAAPLAPFQAPSVADAIDLVSPGCFMVKTDIAGFFPHFPLALLSQWMFLTYVAGVLYRAARCMFGFALCPIFCCAFSAEVARWLRAEFPVSHYCDDFFSASDPAAASPALAEASARWRLGRILAVFASVGLAVAEDKTEIGQRMLVLGLVIDSVSMTLSFDPVAARAYAIELREHRATLARDRHLSPEALARMGGKLVSYCAALPSGLLRVRLIYAHLSAGFAFSSSGRADLILDIDWWLVRLDSWAHEITRPDALPILSPAALLAQPGAIHTFFSDASGPDGRGGYGGPLGCPDPKFFARQWGNPATDFLSSAQGELRALDDYMQCLLAEPDPTVALVIWTTDSQAASGMVNKGSSRSHPCYALLCRIMDAAEHMGIQIVSLWWPREEGAYADYLSHLAVRLNTPSVSGRLSEVAGLVAAADARAAHASSVTAPSGGGTGHRHGASLKSSGGAIRKVRPGDDGKGPQPHPPDVRHGCLLPPGVRHQQQVGSLPTQRAVAAQDGVRAAEVGLATPGRGDTAPQAGQASPPSLSGRLPAERRIHFRLPNGRDGKIRPGESGGAAGGHYPCSRPRRSLAQRGNRLGCASRPNHLVASPHRVHFAATTR
jgi:hypothetical protein